MSQALRVAFDQQIFLLQEYGGISRYVCNLGEALSQIPDVEAKIFAPLHYNGHLATAPRQLVFGLKVPHIPKTFRLVRWASERLAHQAMKRFQPDIVHETYFSNACLPLHGSRRVITVYDMISERFPSMFPGREFTEAKRTAVCRADHVLCISENTRRDLIDLFGIAAERVTVAYLGFDEQRFAGMALDGCAPLPDSCPYLLYVGSRGGYKNFEMLLHAYAGSDYLKSNFRLVAFGGGKFRREELGLLRELGLSDSRVIHLSGGDDMLAPLYQNAAAFVYPSLYEGFGIPPLEAMSLGCPVVCSNASSIPEVVGEAGAYFDPADPESIRTVTEAVLQSSSLRSELVMKGRQRCTAFSWARCARETHAVYRSLL